MLHRVRIYGATVVLAALLLVACKKAEKSNAAGAPAPVANATAPTAAPPDNVPSGTDSKPDKATLSEDKIQRYIKSLGEGKNMFAPPGSASLDETSKWMAEQEAFAKRYGFTGGPDYMDTTGRIDLGLMKVQSVDQMAAARASIVKTLADAEAALRDPQTDAETKTSLTETIADAKQRLADFDAEEKSFNAEDLALIKKFRTAIESAEKANQEAQTAKKG